MIRRLRRTAAAVLAVVPVTAALAADAGSPPYFLRNQNPFLQNFGVPAMEGGALTAPGTLHTRLAFSIANHADQGENTTESIVLDGESYYVDAIFRYGLGERWEVGLDLPYVAHRSGALDNLIEGWHDIFGLDNGERQGPSNHLQLSYRRNGAALVDVRTGSGGIGDVRVTGAYRLKVSGDGARTLALRGALKLPTGDEARLRGSGAADLAVGVEATDRATLASRRIELAGQAGALLLGDGELLADQQNGVVPYAAVGATWHWTAALDLRAQLALQGEYFDSGLDELGGTTASLAVGGVLRLRRLGVELDLALIEDLISDATPDFGLYLSIRRAAAGIDQ